MKRVEFCVVAEILYVAYYRGANIESPVIYVSVGIGKPHVDHIQWWFFLN